MFGFMKSFLGIKSKQLGQEIIEAIVGIDPEGATRAQIEQMEKDLDKAGMALQKIRSDYEREVCEAEKAMQRYEKMMAAAEYLQAKLSDSATPTTEHSTIEASFARLLDQIEEFSHEVKQEKQDMIEVKVLLDEAQTAYKGKADALTGAKQVINRTKRDMQRATLQVERAEEKAKRVAEVAGLRSWRTTNRLSVATDAMQRKAEGARARAAALTMKSNVLALAQPSSDDDPLVAEAMWAIKSKVGTSGAKLGERLAALRKK